MIIVTDGRPSPTSQGPLAQTYAANARAAGIKVYAIGVGGYGTSGTDWGALSNMACGPGVQPQQCNNVFQSEHFDVSVFKQQLLEGLCDTSGNNGSGSSSSSGRQQQQRRQQHRQRPAWHCHWWRQRHL